MGETHSAPARLFAVRRSGGGRLAQKQGDWLPGPDSTSQAEPSARPSPTAKRGPAPLRPRDKATRPGAPPADLEAAGRPAVPRARLYLAWVLSHLVPLLRLETVKPWGTRPQAKLILSPPNLPSPSRPGSELGGGAGGWGGGGRVGLVVIEKLLAYLSGSSLLSQQSGQRFVLGFYY